TTPEGRRRAAAEAANSASLHWPLLRRVGVSRTYRQRFTLPISSAQVRVQDQREKCAYFSTFLRSGHRVNAPHQPPFVSVPETELPPHRTSCARQTVHLAFCRRT